MVAPATVGQPAEEAAELLDDELQLALERVDGPGQRLARAAVAARRRRRAGRASPGTPRTLPEVGERHGRRPWRTSTGTPATSWTSASAQADGLDDAGDRHGVALVADPGDEAAQHAERDRQRDDERGADPGSDDDLDGAAEVLHRGAHDVEPDAAAGGLGDRLAGARSRARTAARAAAGRQRSSPRAAGPRGTAAARSASSSMPRPSSATSMTTVEPAARADDA